MKLLKTIKKLIQESEQRYNEACNNGVSEDELDKLEKNYRDSLNLLNFLERKEKNKKSK